MPSYSKLKAQVSLDGLIALIVFILIIGHVASIYTSLLKSQQETGFKALARYHTLALADYATAIKIMREPGVTSSLDLNLPKGQVPVYGLIFSARTGLIPDPLEEGADLYFKDPYFLPEECE
ncbi:MAG TPA: hypothetical protein VJI67_03795, partial [archaeon]|nr:hypothetical protein [archaeon]